MKLKFKKKYSSVITICLTLIVIAVFLIEATSLFERPKDNEPASTVSQSLSVHFIDVEQGDSTLISCGGVNVLIDAGENDKGDDVLLYLEKQGVTSLDYVIGTHAHSDHIGGLDTVINSIPVKNIILYDLPEKHIPTTKTYLDLLDAIESKNVNLIPSEIGYKFSIGEAEMSILGPIGQDYSDLNNFSIICRLVFGENEFLFMGDAEDISEKNLISQNTVLYADVLKLGHHGSKYSTTDSFLNKVDPKYAIISAGVGNSYGHPANEILTKLELNKIGYYRTDLSGSIVASSDGKEISFRTEK